MCGSDVSKTPGTIIVTWVTELVLVKLVYVLPLWWYGCAVLNLMGRWVSLFHFMLVLLEKAFVCETSVCVSIVLCGPDRSLRFTVPFHGAQITIGTIGIGQLIYRWNPTVCNQLCNIIFNVFCTRWVAPEIEVSPYYMAYIDYLGKPTKIPSQMWESLPTCSEWSYFKMFFVKLASQIFLWCFF